MDITSIIEDLKAYMLEHSITPPLDLIPDGQIHRFHIAGDKTNSKNGWYILFVDDIACSSFGSWKLGITQKWCNKSFKQMSNLEVAQYKINIKTIKEKKRIEQESIWDEASINATKIYNSLKPANHEHAYLVKKQIQPNCARQYYNKLVLPIVDNNNKIWSLQYIGHDNFKSFLTGGKLKGNYIIVRGDILQSQNIGICEGFATGCTLARDNPVMCIITACNSGNLFEVALNIQKKTPASNITIYSDDDRKTDGNPGIKAARKAAIAIGASYIKPIWPQGAPEDLTDFNDLACWLKNKKDI